VNAEHRLSFEVTEAATLVAFVSLVFWRDPGLNLGFFAFRELYSIHHSLHLRRVNRYRIPASCAVKREHLIHGRSCIRSTAVRADDQGADPRRKEQSKSRPRPELRIKAIGISGLGIEVRNRLLKPWHDLRTGTQSLLREKAAHPVAEPHLDTAVPKPAYLEIDLAIVDGLKFAGEVHRTIFAQSYFAQPRRSILSFAGRHTKRGGWIVIDFHRRAQSRTGYRMEGPVAVAYKMPAAGTRIGYGTIMPRAGPCPPSCPSGDR
jgi:hypothetical protein